VDTNLIELFDQRGHLSWRSPHEFRARFAYDSSLLSLLNSPSHIFDLWLGDENSMVYLACISPLWILVPSFRGPRYTHYLVYRVLKQFGFNQDVPLLFKEVVPYLPSLDPSLRLQQHGVPCLHKSLVKPVSFL